jgi:hypothetical protein
LGSFNDLKGLSQLLATDPRLSQCMARTMLTYGLGRSLTAGDECTVRKIEDRAREFGYRSRQFVTSVVLSSAFGLQSGEAGTP